MIIYNNIKEVMRLKRYRQKELSRKIGMTPQQLSEVTRLANPTIKTCIRIARGMGCKVDDLFIVIDEDI